MCERQHAAQRTTTRSRPLPTSVFFPGLITLDLSRDRLPLCLEQYTLQVPHTVQQSIVTLDKNYFHQKCAQPLKKRRKTSFTHQYFTLVNLRAREGIIETRRAQATIYAFGGHIKMKWVAKSLNDPNKESLARKNGPENQKLTLTKIHSADQVGQLVG